MERLTEFHNGIWGMSAQAVKNGFDRYSVYSRLAAYEDTGLTPEQIKALVSDKDEQAGRIMLLEEALKKIANPILHMQKEAKSVGCVLDGVMAIRLSEDPHYYRKIAQKAIDALLGGAEDEGINS